MAGKSNPASGKNNSKTVSLRNYLQARPLGELVELLLRLAGEYDAVREQLEELATLQTADVDALIKQAKQEIRQRTSEVVDSRPWGADHLPDYSKLQARFEALFQAGQYDVLVDLGADLFVRGQAQIEGSRDEGETHKAIQECLKIASRALMESSRLPEAKILHAIDLINGDGFGLSNGVEKVLEKDWPKKVWSVAADALSGRLRGRKRPEGHQRETLVDDIASALDKAGRSAEVLPLYEAEAPITNSYARLVKRLLDADRLDEAERWALEGIGRVESHYGARLRNLLRNIAGERRDWPRVAAYQAETFFDQPDVKAFQELMKAAQKASCEPAVRSAALHFLETGKRPGPGEKQEAAEWPLPETPRLKPDPRQSAWQEKLGPFFTVLIDLAIVEKRPADALHWYECYRQEQKGNSWRSYDGHKSKVAEAVADTHPERAVALYREMVEDAINSGGPSGYEAAAPDLERIRDLLVARGREPEWTSYLAGLRATHGRKRRLMEVLDRVETAKSNPRSE